MAERDQLLQSVFVQLWGRDRLMPVITCSDTDHFDEYSLPAERKYLKQSHLETTHLFALIASCVVGQHGSEEAYKRKFKAACLLRDLMDAKELPSLPAVFLGEHALPVVRGSVRQVADSILARSASWAQFSEWWRMVHLDELDLPMKVVHHNAACPFVFAGSTCCTMHL